jgi:cold shock protein
MSVTGEGVVRTWSEDDGWGVVESAQTPGDVFVHFSAIEMDGYHFLTPGQKVAFTAQPMDIEGCSWQAESVIVPQ